MLRLTKHEPQWIQFHRLELWPRPFRATLLDEWVSRDCGDWGHELTAVCARNWSLAGFGLRSWDHSFLCTNQNIRSLWNSGRIKSADWMRFYVLWARGGNNADTVGVCLGLRRWHHFSVCVLHNWHGLEHLNGITWLPMVLHISNPK